MGKIHGVSSVALLGGFLLSFCGCGSESIAGLVPAEGTVTMNGEAVAEASVVFAGGGTGISSVASTDAQGKFSLMTRGQKGAQPGSYKVTVQKQTGTVAAPTLPQNPSDGPIDPKKMQEEYDKSQSAPPKNELPEKYASPTGTPLQIEIPKGGQKDIKIELTP